MRLQSRCQLGFLSSEGLTRIGGSTSKLSHSHGCWQEASVPYHVELSIGLPKTWQLASPKASDPREGKVEAAMSFMTYPWKSYYIISTQVRPIQCGRGPHKGMNTTRWGLLGAILEAGCLVVEDEWIFPDR